MSVRDDLERLRAARSAEREAEKGEHERLELEFARLVDDAIRQLVEAVDVLTEANVPTVLASLAHKARPNWNWPHGRERVRGWVLNCGDQPVMLRKDGWLAAAHECGDPKRTFCACPFTTATRAVSEASLGMRRLDEVPADAQTAHVLTIRTKEHGEYVDLDFGAWLVRQLADALE